MPAQTSTQDRRAREIANSYLARGYSVKLRPKPDDLPELLAEFQPDLLAEGPDDSVVIQIKGRGSAAVAQQWAELPRLMRIRNAASHGFRTPSITPETVDYLRRLSLRLLRVPREKK